MTDFDVELDMARANVVDEKMDSVLRGVAPGAGDPLAQELASLRQSLSDAFPLPVIEEHVRDAHLARMLAAVVPTQAFAAAPVANDRTGALGSLKASITRRIAAVTVAFSAAFGGAAYAGVLPDPVQNAVSKAASVVGLDLPEGESDVLAENNQGEVSGYEGSGPNSGPAGDGGDDEVLSPSETPDADAAEDERDDARDARQDELDEAEDRQDDAADQREDEADDARDAREAEADQAEDDIEDRRDDAEDRQDDEADEREDGADDSDDALDDAGDEAEDAAEDSREDLDIGEDSRSDLAEDDQSDDDSAPDDDGSDD